MQKRTTPLTARIAPTIWRWRITDDRRVDLTRCATVGRATRAMLIRAAEARTGSPRMPFALHGPSPKDGSDLRDGRHLHAFYLPEDLDGDGLIDHITVYAMGGFDSESLRLLGACEHLRVGRRELWIAPVSVGQPDEPPSRVWVPLTPFVGPHFARRTRSEKPRPSRTAQAQLERIVAARRGLDSAPLPPVSIELIERWRAGHTFLPAADFQIGNRNVQFSKDLAERGWFRLTFDDPVAGPLAFGLAEHFGLGRFVPAISAGCLKSRSQAED